MKILIIKFPPYSCSVLSLAYNWATLSLGDINEGTRSSRLGEFDASLTTLLCKTIIVAKLKMGLNLAELSKKDYASKFLFCQ
jgi:hypothetical protein